MNNFDWSQLINPEFYILMEVGGVKIGLLVILFIIFAETGLFAGFFLPGDSLLFLAGIYSELLMQQLPTGSEVGNVLLLATLVSVAGILGNMVGYWFGVKGGTYCTMRRILFGLKKNTFCNPEISLINMEGKQLFLPDSCLFSELLHLLLPNCSNG